MKIWKIPQLLHIAKHEKAGGEETANGVAEQLIVKG